MHFIPNDTHSLMPERRKKKREKKGAVLSVETLFMPFSRSGLFKNLKGGGRWGGLDMHNKQSPLKCVMIKNYLHVKRWSQCVLPVCFLHFSQSSSLAPCIKLPSAFFFLTILKHKKNKNSRKRTRKKKMLNSEEDERNVDPDEVGHRHNFIGQSFFLLSRQTWKQKVFLLRTEMIIDTPRSGNCQYIVTLLCTAMRMPTNKSQAS